MNSTDNSLITFSEFGSAEGEAVFFFHGWPGSAKQGMFLDKIGKELGLRVIAINRPGIAGSKYVEDRELKDWPKMLNDLAKKLLIEHFSIVAVSGGGPYALACAALIPESLNKVLVVCGAPLLSVISVEKKLFWVYRALIVVQKAFPKVLIKLIDLYAFLWPLNLHIFALKILSFSLCKKDLEVVKHKTQLQIMVDSMRDEISAGGKVLVTDAQIYLKPPGFNLSEITKKVTWWHGKKDRNIPVEFARQMVGLMPNAELIETEEDGHFSIAITEIETIIRTVFKK